MEAKRSFRGRRRDVFGKTRWKMAVHGARVYIRAEFLIKLKLLIDSLSRPFRAKGVCSTYVTRSKLSAVTPISLVFTPCTFVNPRLASSCPLHRLRGSYASFDQLLTFFMTASPTRLIKGEPRHLPLRLQIPDNRTNERETAFLTVETF